MDHFLSSLFGPNWLLCIVILFFDSVTTILAQRFAQKNIRSSVQTILEPAPKFVQAEKI